MTHFFVTKIRSLKKRNKSACAKPFQYLSNGIPKIISKRSENKNSFSMNNILYTYRVQ